jgi:hypothetical protein
MAHFASAVEPAVTVYDGAVLNEDVTWHGSILVRKFVVVAPQATLRIDPGTVVRFAAAAEQMPNIIVQGRIHAAGTSERPILMTSDQAVSARGAWGGIVLLSTEKRNLLEHCRIENADTGIDVHFSTITLQSVTIVQARTALLSHDSVVHMGGSTITDSDTGIEMYASEFDAKNLTISACQQGGVFRKTSVLLASSKITGSRNTGLLADECRIRVSDGDFSENSLGARIQRSEGQISQTRFQHNSYTALHVSDSPVKVQRCQFSENMRDALRTDDDRALFLNNAFTANGGYSLVNSGRENINARLNWWGTIDQSLIRQKIFDESSDKNIGTVHVLPWLNEKPPLMP